MPETDPKLDTRRAAAYLGISPTTLITWRSTQRQAIPYLKLGRRVLYRQSDLDAWLRQQLPDTGHTAAD